MQMTTAVRLERILVAVDFSPPSKHALRYAVHFAKLFEAKLSFLHVAERIGLGIGAETPARFDDADREIKGARKNLQALIASASVAGVTKTAALIRSGLVPHQIVEVAKEVEADLIVIATHGHKGWQRLRLGSTAEQVVRTAPCPVLAVRANNRDSRQRDLKLKRILIPTDFSACAQGGIDYGFELAKKINGEVVLLNVLALNSDERPADAREELRNLRAGDAAIGFIIRRGDPPNEICKAAADLKTDMIVMATHGETSWRHFCLGSTSEAVVHAARCPVLVVREKEHKLM